MKTERVDFHYLGQVSFMAGRSRTVKKQWVPGVVEFELPVIEPGDATTVATGSYVRLWADKPSAIDCLSNGGRTMAPFRVDAAKDGDVLSGRSTLDDFRKGASDPTRNPFYLFQNDEPWPREAGKTLPPDVKTILSDTRGEGEARIRALAETLCVHAGIVYARDREPVIHLSPHGPMGVASTVHAEPARPNGYAFRIDRADVARQAYATMTRSGGYKSELEPRDEPYEVLDPGLLAFREDVHNARVAANHALHHLGGSLAWMPTDLIPMLHRLAVARDGLADGTAEPDDVSALLAECEDARERIPGRLVQLKHVLDIGRGMIAVSLRSDFAARISAEDAESISAFAP